MDDTEIQQRNKDIDPDFSHSAAGDADREAEMNLIRADNKISIDPNIEDDPGPIHARNNQIGISGPSPKAMMKPKQHGFASERASFNESGLDILNMTPNLERRNLTPQ